jgi:hypothetical protein
VEKIIAECAERIIDALGKTRDVNILRLSELLAERSLIIYQAVGWLAREGRVVYEQREKQVYLRLKAETENGAASTRMSP